MDPTAVGIGGIVIFLLLIFLGMPIAFTGAMVGLLGLWVLTGITPAFTAIGTFPYGIIANHAFTVMPLFILMGHLASSSGFVQDLYWAARQWVGRFPGGLALATTIGGAGFAAASGSSIASAAVLTKTALPEMERYKYDPKMATGCIAVVGTLASIIPPSVHIVLYGIFTEQSIGKLLIAGILPGFLTAALYMLMILVRTTFNPSLGPPVYGVPWKERFVSLKGVWGVGLLVILVLGGIYTGLFTPTEAGAVGALGAFLFGFASRRLTLRKVWSALLETGRTTCMLLFLLMGVLIFNRFLAFSGVTIELAALIAGLDAPPMVILIAILALYLILGTFLTAIGMMLVTLPVIYPLSVNLGFDPIWFGILVVMMAEIAMATPPVGLVTYTVHAAAPHIPLTTVFKGVIPFNLMDIVAVALLVAFPQIVLFLPSMIY